MSNRTNDLRDLLPRQLRDRLSTDEVLIWFGMAPEPRRTPPSQSRAMAAEILSVWEQKGLVNPQGPVMVMSEPPQKTGFRKPVLWNGTRYPSIKDASKAAGISKSGGGRWLERGLFTLAAKEVA